MAVKLLSHAPLASQQERDTFLKEASFLEVLKHPYILSIFDVGVYENCPYLIAEYAPNGSLKDRLQAVSPGLLPLEEALRVLSTIGQALSYAHQRNIVHRDLKPANILFNGQGDALLADFNIALKLDATKTQHADVSGTPCYMAPEQFNGVISKKSDQYALGCVAYELVTGQRPFDASEWHVVAFKHMAEIPPSPTQFNPHLPLYIEQAILKAMAKERADRYEEVIDFIAALRAPSPPPQEQAVPQVDTAALTYVSQTNVPTAILSSQPTPPVPDGLGNPITPSRPVLQQSDIDGIVTSLTTSLKQSVSQSLSGQVKTSEKLFASPQCNSQPSHDANVGDIVSTFTITVTVVCTGEVYSTQEVQSMAENLLKSQAKSSLDPNYLLVRNILTMITQVNLVDAKSATFSFTVTAEGNWDFHFNNAQRRQLTQLIAGKSIQGARTILLHYVGVNAANIALTGTFWIWNTIPANLDHITIIAN